MRPLEEMPNSIDAVSDGIALPTLQSLRQISHDASTPLSTIALETYSAQLILGQAMKAVPPENQAILLEIQEILANIAAASRTLNGLLAALSASTTQGHCAPIAALDRARRVDVDPPSDVELPEEGVLGVDLNSAAAPVNPGASELIPGPADALGRS